MTQWLGEKARKNKHMEKFILSESCPSAQKIFLTKPNQACVA